MSNRSLVELNHDYCPREGEKLAYVTRLANYMRSGNPKDLPQGVDFLQMRHHSDPTPTGWLPPQNRPDGYRCLGHFGAEWRTGTWEDDRQLWWADGQTITWSKQHQPTAFLPMPAAPGEPDGEAVLGAAARIRQLEEQVEALRSLAHPGGHQTGTLPLVVYFDNDADRAALIRDITQGKPNVRTVKL